MSDKTDFLSVHSTWNPNRYALDVAAVRRAIDKARQPQIVDGVTYYSTHDVHAMTGLSKSWINWLCLNGKVAYIRVPRHDGDERAPYYIRQDEIERLAKEKEGTNDET